MHALRHHLRRHRRLAALLMALALLVKIAVPTGYMLDVSGGSIGMVLCSGMMQTQAMHAGAMHGASDHGGHDRRNDDHKAELPCAFAGLSAPALASADAVLLAIAIAFVMATGLRRGSPPPIGAPLHLRPPLRGPPATV